MNKLVENMDARITPEGRQMIYEDWEDQDERLEPSEAMPYEEIETPVGVTQPRPAGPRPILIFSLVFLVIASLSLFRIFTSPTYGEFESGDQNQTVAGVGSSELAPFFMPSVLYWEEGILRWAESHNMNPNMVATVMPFHFEASEDGFDPDTNAMRGMNYLAERLIQTNGEVSHAFGWTN
ncbi:MAG: hypothetical protein AAF902_01115 [Chloroflexota bacterium]